MTDVTVFNSPTYVEKNPPTIEQDFLHYSKSNSTDVLPDSNDDKKMLCKPGRQSTVSWSNEPKTFLDIEKRLCLPLIVINFIFQRFKEQIKVCLF